MAKTEKMSEIIQEERYRSNRRKGMSETDALVSMRREEVEEPSEAPTPSSEADYPYGLCIRLESADLDKLGIKKLPAVSSKVTLTAEAVVKSVSSNQSLTDAEERRCVELQITDMTMAPGKDRGED